MLRVGIVGTGLIGWAHALGLQALIEARVINAALVAYQEQRYLRTARVQLTARIFGDIIHTRGGARDLRNHLMAQRTPETFTEVDWLYRGIEAG